MSKTSPKILSLAVILLSTFLFILTPTAYAQEGGTAGNCGDGLDNDGDGYIDCFDGECSFSASCANSTVGQPTPMCSQQPPPGDGDPEVIGRDHNEPNELYIFSGIDGSLELAITSSETDTFLDALALGDVDSDGTGEIFTVARNGDNPKADRRRLERYEHDGTKAWVSDTVIGYNTNADRWSPHLADFNQDGTPEVYLGNQIFNSITGQFIAAGGSTNPLGAHPSSGQEPFPVAVDVLPIAQV